MVMTIVPVILAGGEGTRLWPLSCAETPKAYLSLHGSLSLLQQSCVRLMADAALATPLVVCAEAQRFMVAEQLRQVACRAQIILEPCGRNTAAAVAAAAWWLAGRQPDALMLVVPSDHVITDEAAFRAAVAQAAQIAQGGVLVCIGVEAQHPETGYGYMVAGAARADGGLAVSRFHEKPSRAEAQAYLDAGQAYWHSGITVFSPFMLLEAMRHSAPAIAQATQQAVAHAVQDCDFVRLQAQAYADCPALPVDVAVMERSGKLALVPAVMGWSDIGSYASLWELAAKDAAGNATQGEAVFWDAARNYVYGPQVHSVLLGVEDLVVVQQAGALLVAHRDAVGQLKEVLAQWQPQARASTAQPVYRPWGHYVLLHASETVQVKALHIQPGAKMSLQRHAYRAEHWVVIAGVASVTRGTEQLQVQANESVFVPRGCVHRIANEQAEPLMIMEVQTGSYLGEDDIERLEDDFGRV